MKQLSTTTILAALTLLAACGDDDGTTDVPMDDDMGMVVAMDMAMPDPDMGEEPDALVEPLCDPATCANGSCDGDVCNCDPGWTGELCDALNEPLEDGIAFWFDADAEETITQVDPEIAMLQQWDSRVGPMTVVAQVNEYPEILTGGASFANGRPTITFDGIADQLLGIWSAGGATEYTVFAVFNAIGGNQTIMDVQTQSADDVLRIRLGGPVSPFQLQATVEDGATNDQSVLLTGGDAAVGDMVVMAVRVSASEVALWRDGAEADAMALTTPLYDGIETPFVTFGSTDASQAASEYYGGSLAEVIAFDAAITDGVVEAISAYLDAKWR